MCGISGIIHLDGSEVSESQVTSMMKAMKHRGPNDEGKFLEKGLGLGFVRLSIIDLSAAGHQPMFSGDGRYVMIFNGEVYNYIELREELLAKGYTFKSQTDTEVILTAYQEWGEEMLHRFNGMWALVIYDRQEQILFGARDRYGIKPFYYCIDHNRVLFASEIPSILAVLGRKPTPQNEILFDFLVFNRTDHTSNTFFSEVKRLDHGHFFKIDLKAPQNGRPKSVYPQRWYKLKEQLKTPFKNPQEYREMFSSAVGLRLRSDVPIGVCLSGGLDSSSIVSSLLKDYNTKELNTFSAVYGQGKKGDESNFINLYKGELKNMHFTWPNENTFQEDMEHFLRCHYEPVPTTTNYAQYSVMKLAKEHVTVTLDGQGADEELAGYHYFFGFRFKELLLKGRLDRLFTEMRHYYTKHRSLYGLKSFLFFLLPTAMRTKLRAKEKGYVDTDFYQAYSKNASSVAGNIYGSSSIQNALVDHFEYKLEHLLKWEDRNSMMFSLEARVPFLDHRLVERTLSLNGDLIINEGMTKYILRQAMKGTLPEPIRERRDKIGFETPQDEWFRAPVFKKYIEDIIHSESFKSRGLMDINKVHAIYNKHMNRQGNFANEIWKWIHLEKWYRQFID